MQDENHTIKAEQKKKRRKLVGLASFFTKNLCRSKSQTLNMISRNEKKRAMNQKRSVEYNESIYP